MDAGNPVEHALEKFRFTFEPPNNNFLVWAVPRDLARRTGLHHYTLVIRVEHPVNAAGETSTKCIELDVVHDDLDAEVKYLIPSEVPRGQCCRAELKAFGGALGDQALHERPVVVRFVAKVRFEPGSDEAEAQRTLLVESLGPSFRRFRKVNNRDPLIMNVALCHEGKSSNCNHTKRSLQGKLDLPSVCASAPGGEEECTKETRLLPIPFKVEDTEEYTLSLLDTPAFSHWDEGNKRDFEFLLKHTPENWRRLERPKVPERQPDGLVVLVSLHKVNDQGSSLKDWFKQLNVVRKKLGGGIPMVVVATKLDDFYNKHGNMSKNPLQEVKVAMDQLRRFAQTDAVFALEQYHSQRSWLDPTTHKSTVEYLIHLLEQNLVVCSKKNLTTCMFECCIVLVVCIPFCFFVLLFVCPSWSLEVALHGKERASNLMDVIIVSAALYGKEQASLLKDVIIDAARNIEFKQVVEVVRTVVSMFSMTP